MESKEVSNRLPKTVPALVGKSRSFVALMLLLMVFAVFGSALPLSADTTLQILDIQFPEECGAAYVHNTVQCAQCHFSESMRIPAADSPDPRIQSATTYRPVESIDEYRRIVAVVPAETLATDQPFVQSININGHVMRYEYGYNLNGIFHPLETLWLSDAKSVQFSYRHDGVSFPLLSESTQYVFVVRVLYNRYGKSTDWFKWEELVLLWTIPVGGDHV